MADDEAQSSIIPKPADPAITWHGKPLTAKRIVDFWQSSAIPLQPFHNEVRRARDFRRGDLRRKIDQRWATRHPEAAAAAQARLHQRRTLEQDLKARLGLVQPSYLRKAIGDLQRDQIGAEACQDYLNEWGNSEFGVPFYTYLSKLVEDGGFLRVRLPTSLDMEGRPDFFERLDARAYAKLDDDEKRHYKRDTDGKAKKKKPYVRVDESGEKVPAKPYREMMELDDDEKKLPPMRRANAAKRRSEKAQAAHDEAVQRYLLGRPASTAQVYSGLDCAPVFKRGIGREQSELAAVVIRQLVTVVEALEGGYGWKGMGSRLLAPTGNDEKSTVGRDGSYYLYTLLHCSKDDDGIEHPMVHYTIGGKGTSFGTGLEPGTNDEVGTIDLYDEMGLQGPLWSWHWGLQTHDDDPAYRGRPYLSDLIDLMLAIEGEEMAIRATTQVNAFTGYVENLGRALSGPNSTEVAEAVIEKGPDGSGTTIRAMKIPAPGEIEPTMGDIEPFNKATIGQDAWQITASDRQALAEAVAVDQAASSAGASGRAMVVGETLAKVAKKDIREGALQAWIQDGEDQLKILQATYECYGIKWPIQKVEAPPAGDVGGGNEKYTVAEFDPDWLGDGRFLRLKAEYPAEENLAAVDLERALADGDYSHFAAVCKKRGIIDPEAEWLEVLKWKMRRHPLYVETIMQRLAQRRGDKTMLEIIKQLQSQKELTQGGVPGAPMGVPAAALRRAGEQGEQQGGGSMVSASRGGQQAAEMQTAQMNQEAMMSAQVGQGAI